MTDLHRNRRRALLGLLVPLGCALLFLRLGTWQVARHRERAAFNDGLAERLEAAPVPFADLPADPAERAWRRVVVAGRFRYDLEQVQAGRTNAGSPGVHLLTPLERPGTDTLVVVTRGWVYSPDASSADLARWREGADVVLSGYVLTWPEGDTPPPRGSGSLRSPTRAALVQRLGHPVAAEHLVMTSDSAARADSVPRRLALPARDGGPHLSYAIQWFAFATIAVVGGVLLHRRALS